MKSVIISLPVGSVIIFVKGKVIHEITLSDTFTKSYYDEDTKHIYEAFLDYFFKNKDIDLPFDIWWATDKEKIVYNTLLKTKRGETVTYKELAERSGFKNAARFVGNTMRKNRLPIIIPCHRVVSSKGIGGFSANIEWKKFLLWLESSS